MCKGQLALAGTPEPGKKGRNRRLNRRNFWSWESSACLCPNSKALQPLAVTSGITVNGSLERMNETKYIEYTADKAREEHH